MSGHLGKQTNKHIANYLKEKENKNRPTSNLVILKYLINISNTYD